MTLLSSARGTTSSPHVPVPEGLLSNCGVRTMEVCEPGPVDLRRMGLLTHVNKQAAAGRNVHVWRYAPHGTRDRFMNVCAEMAPGLIYMSCPQWYRLVNHSALGSAVTVIGGYCTARLRQSFRLPTRLVTFEEGVRRILPEMEETGRGTAL